MDGRNKYTEQKYDFFIFCVESEYLLRQSQLEQERTPAVAGKSPYKIHISFAEHQYASHMENIKKILLNYMSNTAFNHFKYVDSQTAKEILIADNNDNDSLVRFLKSDQFTIYIVESFDMNQILNMCNEIQSYIIKNNIQPDVAHDVISQMTPHINLRQEYLLADFNKINHQGYLEKNLRINTTPQRENEELEERRKLVKIEQENCKLYQYLRQNIQTQLKPTEETHIYSDENSQIIFWEKQPEQSAKINLHHSLPENRL